jgi:Fe2+ transport system protein FeoA
MELRDMGMTEDKEIQLMQEINDAMQICEDLTS